METIINSNLDNFSIEGHGSGIQGLVCNVNKNDYSSHVEMWIIQGFLILYLLLSGCLVIQFWRHREWFPIKGSAPWLNILHQIYFWLILAIPLTAEIIVAQDTDLWASLDPVPEMRKAMKGFYMAVRMMSIATYFSRSCHVYFTWNNNERPSGNCLKKFLQRFCLGWLQQ